jgi:hypothetical protein
MILSDKDLNTNIKYINSMSMYDINALMKLGHKTHIFFCNDILKKALTDKARSYKLKINLL